MSQKTLLVALALVVVAVGSWQIATEAQPGSRRPLTLHDANGVYLGNLIGFDTVDEMTYTSYLESVNGVLSFNMKGQGPSLPIGGGEYSFAVYFESTDCTGTAYFLPTTLFVPDHMTILSVFSKPGVYRVSNATTTLMSNSVLSGLGCYAEELHDLTLEYRALQPVTLPFDIETIEAPFSIVSQ